MPHSKALADALAEALAHHHAGRLAVAETAYRRVIDAEPSHSATLLAALQSFGVLLHQRGEHAHAAALLDRALALDPADAACWSNRGLTASALGDFAFGVTCQERALALDPSFANARNNLGVALQALGRFDEAEQHYRRLLADHPAFADAQINLGVLLGKSKRHDEALALYREMLAHDPSSAAAHFGAGNALRELGRPDEAIASFETAVERAPNHFEAQANLGAALGLAGRFEAAEARYRHALTLRDDPQIHACIGAALGSQGLFHQEEAHYRRALALAPDHADALHNLALLHLRRGEFVAGWALHEGRWRSSKFRPMYLPGVPEWRGEPLEGRRLLLAGEQGHGDQMQFVRYAAVLARMGAEVEALVPDNLAELVRSVPGVARVVTGDMPFDHDFWTPMMSVPHRVSALLPEPLAEVPYMSVSAARAEGWAARVSGLAGAKRRVGVVWAGSPTFSNDRYRSMPARALNPLGEIPGIAWFSLQMGAARAQLEDTEGIGATLSPHDLSGHIRDFADTAALIQQLDLVISVDTSVVHLAGALGKPAWVMVPANWDWRWALDRDDNPWYPATRVFRQTKLGDWRPVIESVKAALA